MLVVMFCWERPAISSVTSSLATSYYAPKRMRWMSVTRKT